MDFHPRPAKFLPPTVEKENEMDFTPVKKRAITKQTLSMTKGVEYYLGFLSEMFLGEKVESKSGPSKEPPQLADVVNFETGEINQVIIPSVMYKELVKAFPAGVNGVCLAVTIIPPREGKNYNLCNLTEIEPPTQFMTLWPTYQQQQGRDPEQTSKVGAGSGTSVPKGKK